jgi:DNA invertase Pin-like site-specific DNA recombinase
MESGVEFVAVDNPHANKLTIHILAAVAEHEREMISERTKAALAAAKKRGQRLRNPQPRQGCQARHGRSEGECEAVCRQCPTHHR